jgi:purine nucleosidase
MPRLVLDTDIGSDVDDALALAFCLRHPDIDLAAVTTVADDTVWRARIATTLLRLADRSDVLVAPGVGWEAGPGGVQSRWPGDSEGFDLDDASYERDGVDVLLEQTPAEVATIGMQSNIAAALDRDPSFASRVTRLNVMGGMFAKLGDEPPSRDHNLVVDPDAAVRSLNAKMPTLYLPIDVSFHARLLVEHREKLRTGDALCRALAHLLDVWAKYSNPSKGVAAILHDPLLVACTVDRRFVASEVLPVTVVRHGDACRTFIDPVVGHPSEVITSVDGPSFAEFWLETVFARGS